MKFLHAARATNLSNANERPNRSPNVGLSGFPANQNATAGVLPEDVSPRGAVAGLSSQRIVVHIGDWVCASQWGRADGSRGDGCCGEWCLHGPHPWVVRNDLW